MAHPGAMMAIALAGVSVALGSAAVAPTDAVAAPACAATTDPTTPAQPSPGTPCWTDVQPYPFGVDGDPVDTNRGDCPSKPDLALNLTPGPLYTGPNVAGCYLQVTSMAFRAWNRGLAATKEIDLGGRPSTTAFGVWLFNGTRWFPDPTFPGKTTCGGDTILWAGKLDYWLVGAGNFGALCRFDGSSFAWQPLSVPAATIAQKPAAVQSADRGIRTGTCFAWNDCTFLGDYGTVVRWDGTTLTDATPDHSGDPSLLTPFTAAVARIDTGGNPFAVAVGTSGGPLTMPSAGSTPDPAVLALPPRPDGSPPPQLFASTGGAYSPTGFTPPTTPKPLDPYRTDLLAVDFDAERRGWVAGNPVGVTVANPALNGRSIPTPATARQLSPLTPVSTDGARPGCPGPASDRFTFVPNGVATLGVPAYLWSSVAVLPGSGDALAGGSMRTGIAGAARNDDGLPEPVLARVRCDGAVTETRFRIPDPTADPATAPLVPANRVGATLVAAATASNDAWAMTLGGTLARPVAPGAPPPTPPTAPERPHLYRLTDGLPPNGPTGNDVEPRPIEIRADPPIFVDEPVPQDAPAPLAVPPVVIPAPKVKARKRLKAAVYAVHPSKPRTIASGSDKGRVILEIRFRLRRPVTIGLRGLRKGKVVSSSGLKRFKGTRGKLLLTLDRDHWPTKLTFYSPAPAKPKKNTTKAAPAAPRVAGPKR